MRILHGRRSLDAAMRLPDDKQDRLLRLFNVEPFGGSAIGPEALFPDSGEQRSNGRRSVNRFQALERVILLAVWTSRLETTGRYKGPRAGQPLTASMRIVDEAGTATTLGDLVDHELGALALEADPVNDAQRQVERLEAEAKDLQQKAKLGQSDRAGEAATLAATRAQLAALEQRCAEREAKRAEVENRLAELEAVLPAKRQEAVELQAGQDALEREGEAAEAAAAAEEEAQRQAEATARAEMAAAGGAEIARATAAAWATEDERKAAELEQLRAKGRQALAAAAQ